MSKNRSSVVSQGVFGHAARSMVNRHESYRRRGRDRQAKQARIEAAADTSTGAVCLCLRDCQQHRLAPVDLSTAYKTVIQKTTGMKPHRRKKEFRTAALSDLRKGLDRLRETCLS